MARSISSIASSSSLASSIKSSSSTNKTTLKCKLNVKPKSGPVDKRKRLAANARERKRMDLLNKAFDQLRGRLNDARDKSKYDVLVQAKEYIQALARICADHDRAAQSGTSGVAPESAKLTLDCQMHDSPIESKLETLNDVDSTTHQLDLSIAKNGPAQWPRAIQSPASSSDCCLSPMSLADSLGSSGSPRCPSYSQQQSHQFYHHHLATSFQSGPEHNSKTAVFYRSHRQFKQEPIEELPSDFHQFHHTHYQSLLESMQKQAPIN